MQSRVTGRVERNAYLCSTVQHLHHCLSECFAWCGGRGQIAQGADGVSEVHIAVIRVGELWGSEEGRERERGGAAKSAVRDSSRSKVQEAAQTTV
jgi:hypothetical protein